MRLFSSSLPVFLVLSLFGAPLALRADQSQPAQDTVQQSTQVSYADLQADPALTMQDTTPVLISDPANTDPVMLEPIQVGPGQVGPIDVTSEVGQISDPDAPSDPAVTPEPSGVVLLATGVLCGMLFWMRRGSAAMLPC